MEWKRKATAVMEIPQRLNTVMLALAVTGILSIIALWVGLVALTHAN
jgi:hypothetical protein